MNKKNSVDFILKNRSTAVQQERGTFFAPSNIALGKYWGKRNTELNLPVTSSLSVSLGGLGAKTTISLSTKNSDQISVNGALMDLKSVFAVNLRNFLDLFRNNPTTYYQVETEINIPIGAGLASSACGYAAIVGALNQLYGWDLSCAQMSLLGRLGSGSASRSFWQGFVEWQAGVAEDGMDSLGVPLLETWPELRIGLVIFNAQQKSLSSRSAMQRTVLTSPFYASWPAKQAADMNCLRAAIQKRDFVELGSAAESNALAMHALMLTASPPCVYSEPHTLAAMQKIWQLRQEGLSLYFTQDAGPNLKLLFLEKDLEMVKKLFPEIIIVAPFGDAERVVLVDEQDQVIGTEEKLKAHQLALLHRAFSVFVYRKKITGGETKFEFLLQQRHPDKYHCGGLWTNTCCSHPRLGETVLAAAQRRLKEEMSLEVSLNQLGFFVYQANFENGLSEHELDHVLLGEYDGVQPIVLNPTEVQASCWVESEALQHALSAHPERYTPWLKPAFRLVLEELCIKS